MTTTKVHEPVVVEPDASLTPDLVALRRFAWLLDSAFAVPGTKRRVGIEAGIGLIPGIGDFIGGVLSTWVVVGAIRHRVRLPVLVRMLGNILFDVGLGLVPVVGDVGDMFFKPSMKNVELLLLHRDRTRPPRRGRDVFIFASVIIGFFVVASLAVIVGGFALLIWAVNGMMGR